MKNFFRYDGPLTRFGNQIGSMFLLNILTLLCSIPIISFGAAITALHYVTFQIVNDEEPAIWKTFFKAFKQNFKKATKIWLFFLFLLLVLTVDFQIINLGVTDYNAILTIAVAAVTIFVIWIIIWSFILISRYEDSNRHTIKNAALMIPLYPMKSLVILVAVLIPILMCFISYVFLIFAIALGFTIPAYIQAIVYRNVFMQLENSEKIQKKRS